MAQFTMDIQGKSQKFYVPSLGEYTIRQGQTFQEDGSLGKELIKYHGEHVILGGPSALELLGNSKNTFDKLEGLVASASEINGSVGYSFAGIRNIRKSTSAHFFGKVFTSILGDSHSVGIGTIDFIGYAQKLRNAINFINNSSNIGVGTKYNFVTTGFTLVENDSATDTISGFYLNIPNGSSIRCYVEKNTNIKIITSEADASKIINLEIRKSNLSTVVKSLSVTIGEDGISTTGINNNGTDTDMYIVNNSGSSIKLTGIYQYISDDDQTSIIFANGGRKLSGITDAVIDKWFDNSEYAILSLSNNDSDISLFTNRINYIRDKYNNQSFTKLIILDLNVSNESGEAKRNELKRLNKECVGSIFISIPESFTSSGTFPEKEDLYNLGLLDSDLVHYTKYGHEFIYGCLSKALNISEVPNSITFTSLKSNFDNLLTSGNLISSTWDTTVIKETESAATVSLRNGYVTIDKANSNNPIYKSVTLNPSGFKYIDFSGYSDYEKDNFKLKASSALITAPTGTTRVALSTPMVFAGGRLPLRKSYYINTINIYFSRDVTISILVPFMGFYYASGKYYLDDVEYVVGSKTISAGWHIFKAINTENTQTHKFHPYLDKMNLFRLDISGTEDIEIIMTEPSVEVGGDIKYLVSKV